MSKKCRQFLRTPLNEDDQDINANDKCENCGTMYMNHYTIPESSRNMKKKKKEKPWYEDERITSAFKNLGPIKGAEECMIHVSWSGQSNRPGSEMMSHHIRRGEVIADLGLDEIPNPHFSKEEMQLITYAAKMRALKCLRDRKKKIPKCIQFRVHDEAQGIDGEDKCENCGTMFMNHAGSKRR